MILLVRMVLPWAPDSALSIHNLTGDPWAADPQPMTISPNPSLWPLDAPAMTRPDAGVVLAADSAQRTDASLTSLAARMTPAAFLTAVWLGGALLLTALTIVVNIVHWRRICQAPPVTDAAALRLLRQCRRKMGLARIPCLVETDHVRGPALSGMIRPRLLLPTGTIASLSPTDLRHVFKHELAHIKRHDILLRAYPITSAARSVMYAQARWSMAV